MWEYYKPCPIASYPPDESFFCASKFHSNYKEIGTSFLCKKLPLPLHTPSFHRNGENYFLLLKMKWKKKNLQPQPKRKQYQNHKYAVSHNESRARDSPAFLLLDICIKAYKRDTPSFTLTNTYCWWMSYELWDANGPQKAVGPSASYFPCNGSDLQQQ